MKDNTQVFESYSVPRAVRTLALPSMMGMLVNIVYNLADTFFVGQTGNANMVAAVSVTMPLFLLFIACGNLFGVGGCAFVSRSLGEGKTERVKTISSFCVYSAIGVGLVMTVLFLVFRKPVLYAVGASDATFAYAADYLKYVAIGSPFIVSSVMLGNLVRGEGAARVSMIGSIIGQVVNIVLDPIFILNKGDKLFGLIMPFGTGQGVAGAAIATVIGNVVSVVFFLIYFLRGKSILSISPGRYRVRGGIARGVITVGLPAAINNLLMSISNMLINVFLQGYGDNAVAAMGIALKVSMIAVLVLIGFAFGVQPLIGYNYGAQNYRRLRQVLRFSYQFTIGLGLVLTVIVFAAAPLLIRLFMQDGSVYDLGVAMLRRLLLGTAFYAFTLVTTCVFQATGKAVGAFVLSISGQGVIYGLVIWALSSIWGYDGVIVTQPVADVLTCLLAVVLYFTSLHRIIRKGVAEQKQL